MKTSVWTTTEGVPTTAQMSSLDSPVAVPLDTDWTLTTEDVLVSSIGMGQAGKIAKLFSGWWLRFSLVLHVTHTLC